MPDIVGIHIVIPPTLFGTVIGNVFTICKGLTAPQALVISGHMFIPAFGVYHSASPGLLALIVALLL